MDINEQNHGDIVLINLSGRLDSLTHRDLENYLLNLIGKGNTAIVIDFANLDYISSAGLRVLLMAAKRIRTAQGKMALAAMQRSIREIFDISGFSSIFEIYPSAQDALQALA